MPVYGKVIVIRRNGSDGSQFPLTNETCLFGRSLDCDVRVQLPYVSNQQCKLQIDENGKFLLHNLSETNQTTINGKAVENGMELTHKDVLTIVDRSFRFEYPEGHEAYHKSPSVLSGKAFLPKPKTPLQEKQEPACDSPFSILVKDMKHSIKMKKTNKIKNEVPDILTPRFRKNDSPIFASSEQSFPKVNNENKECKVVPADAEGVDNLEPETSINKESNSTDCTDCIVDYNSSVTPEPTISLSIKNTPQEEYDPYDFSQSERATKKKFRRRSSGSSGLSRNKQLALFGSPRTPNITPLRRSLGELKKKSIPLVEDLCEDISTPPHNSLKKNWDPLPEVEEVENNSSPVKKSRHSPKIVCESPLVLDESIKAVRRRSSRVSFGPKLSPEQFLKHLPPNTPVKKGATPHDTETTGRRKSMRLSSLCTVVEAASPTGPPSEGKAKKQTRTPTPFRPSKNAGKQPNLLHNALRNIMDKKFSGSTMNDVSLHTDEIERHSDIQTLEQVKSKKSTGNVTLLNVHRTATNLHKRKSIGKLNSKPLWSEVVKRGPANKQTKSNVKNMMTKKENKVNRKKQVSKVLHNDHHCESPATLYIGRTHKIIQPTRTPRPPKGPLPTKLNIPLDENFTGIEEMFQTPTLKGKSTEKENLYDDLQTPENVGEMQLSPFDTSDEVESDVEHEDVDLGASPLLCKKKQTTKDSTGDEDNNNAASVTKMRNNAENMKAQVNDSIFGTRRLFKTPRSKKNQPVKENFGLKRMLTTPKDKTGGQAVNDKFGTKRLLKTPGGKEKNLPVADKFGIKRLLTTPKVKENVDPVVAEKFGTKRLLRTPAIKRKYNALDESICMDVMMKTPEADRNDEKKSEILSERTVRCTREQKNEAVAEHFGTKRIFKTPKSKMTSQAVTEKLGTKRLLTTPKLRAKQEPVNDKFGMKRLLKTPREKQKEITLEGNFGTDRLFGLAKKKYQPVQHNYGTVRLFQTHAKRVKQDFDDSMCLDDLFQEDHIKTPVYAGASNTVEPKKVKQASKIQKVTRTSKRNARSKTEDVKINKEPNVQAESANSNSVCDQRDVETEMFEPVNTLGCVEDNDHVVVKKIVPRVTRSGKPKEAVPVRKNNRRAKKAEKLSPEKENVHQNGLQQVEELSLQGPSEEVNIVNAKSLAKKGLNKRSAAKKVTATIPTSRCTRSKAAPQEVKTDVDPPAEDTTSIESNTSAVLIAQAVDIEEVVSSKKPKRAAGRPKQRTTRSCKTSKLEEQNIMPLMEQNQVGELVGTLADASTKKVSSKSVTFHHTVVGGMTPLPTKRSRRTRKVIQNSTDKPTEVAETAEQQPAVFQNRTRKRAAKSEDSITLQKSKRQKVAKSTTESEDKEIPQDIFKPKPASRKRTKSSPAAVQTPSIGISEAPVLRRSSRRKK